jgi:hypothetical protein
MELSLSATNQGQQFGRSGLPRSNDNAIDRGNSNGCLGISPIDTPARLADVRLGGPIRPKAVTRTLGQSPDSQILVMRRKYGGAADERGLVVSQQVKPYVELHRIVGHLEALGKLRRYWNKYLVLRNNCRCD